MRFEINQELVLKNEPIKIKIVGLMSGSQPVMLSTTGENHYNIEIMGFKTCISEGILDLLVKKPELEKPKPINSLTVEQIPKVEKINTKKKSIIDKIINKKSTKKGR